MSDEEKDRQELECDAEYRSELHRPHRFGHFVLPRNCRVRSADVTPLVSKDSEDATDKRMQRPPRDKMLRRGRTK